MSRDSRLLKFFETAMERQIIYAQKELRAPKPWTSDSQFNTWFFCNVFRSQDKATKWIVEHICKKYAGDPLLWKKLYIARRLSRIESMEALESVDGYANVKAGRTKLEELRDKKIPYLTNAFIVGQPREGIDRIGYMYELMEYYESIHLQESLHGTIQEGFEALNSEPHAGPFMSYETVTDYTYCPQYLQQAPDMYSWANTGPGCVRGINVIEHGSADITLVKSSRALMVMRIYFDEWKSWLASNLSAYKIQAEARAIGASDYLSAFDNLTMREVEHWLCEFDKHERVGKNKRRYPL